MSALSSVQTFVLDPCLPLDEDIKHNNEVFIFISLTDMGIDSLSTWVQKHLDYPQKALGSDLKPHGQLANQL